MFKKMYSRKVTAYFLSMVVFTGAFFSLVKWAPNTLEWVGITLLWLIFATNVLFISFNSLDKGMKLYAEFKKGR